ncbi:MADS-box protein JOINTLESS-like [Solanum tuberosum]|uniref:MADS-box protein JOINTLESS-like n=1 Tax=Solanum tuberosum TaxID=4113 RepID=UPI00073A3566|nr:PREDICTED: MADS-box protein JOINTLESS-like [Solanum tuberosum]
MTKRQVIFSKRRSSLLKKAAEIAICCDVDMLFVAFSPAARLGKFCSKKRIENLELQIKKSTLELQIVDANISSSIQESIYQDRMDKGKRVANNFRNYTYTPSFASSSQSRNIPFSQIQDLSPYIPFQSQQQNMVIDVQQNSTQTFVKSQENTMGNNEYHVENTLENDAWEWDDVFLNEALNGEEFRNLD